MRDNPFTNKYYGIKSKNVGSFLVFSDRWFEKYQPYLLFLLNVPVFRLWFRWVLRIHKDCRYSDAIVEIQPNNYKVLLSDGQIRGDFRTHPKFSKRVYFAFRLWWWVLHYMDEFFKVVALDHELNFGFDTLTAYPDPNEEVSTVDGTVLDGTLDVDFSFYATAAGTAAYPSEDSDNGIGATYSLRAYTNTDKFRGLWRWIFLFATNIGSSATISGAVLSLKRSGTAAGLGEVGNTIVSSNPASNTDLVAGDFDCLGSTAFGALGFGDIVDQNYGDFTLNASGISNIDKTGISKFGSKNTWDFSGTFGGTWGSGLTTGYSWFLADYTATTSDPKLVITYTGGSAIKTVCGLAYASVKTANSVAKASIKTIIGLA